MSYTRTVLQAIIARRFRTNHEKKGLDRSNLFLCMRLPMARNSQQTGHNGEGNWTTKRPRAEPMTAMSLDAPCDHVGLKG